jgi:hypothetical protein
MSTSKNYIYINTAPKANTKKDGSIFYTVLVGLSAGLAPKEIDTITMNVFENQIELFANALVACKKSGSKLAIVCDKVIVTEPKENSYINSSGELVTSIQASCWADGPSELTVVKNTLAVSDSLSALLGE